MGYSVTNNKLLQNKPICKHTIKRSEQDECPTENRNKISLDFYLASTIGTIHTKSLNNKTNNKASKAVTG